MNFLFLRILVVLVPFLISSQGHAATLGIFAEPYAGYSFMGSVNGGEDNDGKYHGFTLGSRAGIEIGSFLFIGPDFIWTSTGNFQSAIGKKITNDSRFSLGLTAGIIIPDTSFRFWFGYYPIEQMQFSYSTVTDSTTRKSNLLGNSIKLGVGYKLLSYLSLNAEYMYAKYNNIENIDPLTNQISEKPSSLNSSSVLLSLSVPLTFALE